MKLLTDHFDRVALVSLRESQERRWQSVQRLVESGLVRDETDVDIFDAIDGRATGMVAGWGAGAGAYGCWASHVGLLSQCASDRIESVLVLEDDICIHPDAPAMLAEFMAAMENREWDMIYLGGQHWERPSQDGGILRCNAVVRTHAYAVHRRGFSRVLPQLANLPDYVGGGGWHCDNQLAAGMRDKYAVWAPEVWLFGQGANESTIQQREVETMWWHWDGLANRLPLAIVDNKSPYLFSPRPEFVERALRPPPGKWDDSDRSRAILSNHRKRQLKSLLPRISRRALVNGKFPALPTDAVTREEIDSIWPAGSVDRVDAEVVSTWPRS